MSDLYRGRSNIGQGQGQVNQVRAYPRKSKLVFAVYDTWFMGNFGRRTRWCHLFYHTSTLLIDKYQFRKNMHHDREVSREIAKI